MLSPKRLFPPLCLAAALIFAAPAAAQYDVLPGAAFNGTSDTPYASAATATGSASYNNQLYTEDSGETNSPTVFLGCGRWGSKTAWVRFATAVSGGVNVSVDSSIPGAGGYDVFYKLYLAPSASSDYSQVSPFVSPGATPCNATRVGVPDEQGGPFPVLIPRGQSRVLYVQVLSVCREDTMLPACDSDERSMAPGGDTSVTMSYIPNDGDDDGVADTVDACPAQKNPCSVDADDDDYFANPLPGQRLDCDDGDPTRNSGRKEIRGNRKDDDCDGRGLPYLRVTNRAKELFAGRFGRAERFKRLYVPNAPRGLTVVVECVGRGCPGVREYRAKTRQARLNVRGKLGRVRLAPRARVTVKLLRKGRVGRVQVYRFRRRGTPTESVRCTLPGRRTVLRLAQCAPRGADAAASRR